jgi:glycosyltransferase involved in cell wall biosynthesis
VSDVSVRSPRLKSLTSPPGGAPRLRVLVALQGDGMNGIDTYAEQIALAGDAAGHDVTLLVTGPDVAHTVRTRLPASIHIEHIGLAAPGRLQAVMGRLWDSVAMRRLARALRRALRGRPRTYDVAHVNRPVLARELRGVARTVVVSAWFYPHAPIRRVFSAWEHNRGPFARRAVLAGKSVSYYLGDARGFSDADRVVAPTPLLADQLRTRGFAAEVCPPPVQVDAGGAGPNDGEPSGEAIRLVSVCGDLTHPRKNMEEALDAAALLARPGRRVMYEIIGRNPDQLALKAKELPDSVQVLFPGPLGRAELHRRVRAAHVLVLPSLYEEWGYVAVEALLLGTPVATYPVYPVASMLADGLGAVAAGMQPAELARAIERALVMTRGKELAQGAALRYGAHAVGARLSRIWCDTRGTHVAA